jgi:hypothetical protein
MVLLWTFSMETADVQGHRNAGIFGFTVTAMATPENGGLIC